MQTSTRRASRACLLLAATAIAACTSESSLDFESFDGSRPDDAVDHVRGVLSLTQDVYREAGFSIHFNKLTDSKDC